MISSQCAPGSRKWLRSAAALLSCVSTITDMDGELNDCRRDKWVI